MENFEVFILTYNRAHFLKEQLISVCNQTLNDFDIYILNNASTDNTVEIVEEICKKYPSRNIKLITHPKNIGSAANFQYAIDNSSKEYVSILCDDDILHPLYYERAFDVIKKHPEAGIISSNYHFTRTPEEFEFENYLNNDYLLWPAGLNVCLMIYETKLAFQNMIYKTSLIKSVLPEHEKYGKHFDVMFIRKMLTKADCINLENAFGIFRVHEDQDTCNPLTAPSKKQLMNRFHDNYNLVRKYGLFGIASELKDVENMTKDYDFLLPFKEALFKLSLRHPEILFYYVFQKVFNKIVRHN